MALLGRRMLLGSLAVLLSRMDLGHAQPLELKNVLPSVRLAGSSRFSFLGFGVYDASLWVGPGFKAGEYQRHSFALELAYLRDFSNEAITQKSIEEMQRQPGFPALQSQAWRQFLLGAFPDVRNGDRIMGIHRPAEGTTFVTNGRTTGQIADTEFGRFFFGVWLSVHTAEPGLRQALLAGAVPP